jgi:uncharacterized membrane protein
MDRSSYPRIFLILGLAYVFAFFGIGKLVHPLLWIQWIPPFAEGLFGLTREVWLTIAGVMEILLAIGLLMPVRKVQKIVAVLLALHLVMVLSQTGLWHDIGVRDMGLLFMALALMFAL